MVSLNGRLFINISGYNFYWEITPEHPRQFHMEVALGDRPQVWKEILILLERVHMSDVVKKLKNFHDKKTTKDKWKSNYYFIVIFGYSLNKLQFYSPPFFFSGPVFFFL